MNSKEMIALGKAVWVEMRKNSSLKAIAEEVKTPEHIVDAIIYITAIPFSGLSYDTGYQDVIQSVEKARIDELDKLVLQLGAKYWWQYPGTLRKHLVSLKRALGGDMTEIKAQRMNGKSIRESCDPMEVLRRGTILELADKMGMARGSISNKWKNEMGQQFQVMRTQAMQTEILEETKKCLTEPHKGIDELAKEWNMDITTINNMIVRFYGDGIVSCQQATRMVGRIMLSEKDIAEVVLRVKQGVPYSTLIAEYATSAGNIQRWVQEASDKETGRQKQKRVLKPKPKKPSPAPVRRAQSRSK